MPWIAAKPFEQVIDRFARAFDNLQEVRAVEDEQSGNAIERVQLPRRTMNVFQV